MSIIESIADAREALEQTDGTEVLGFAVKVVLPGKIQPSAGQMRTSFQFLGVSQEESLDI